MTRLQYLSRELKIALEAFNARVHGSYSEYLAKAAIEAMNEFERIKEKANG